MVDTPASVSDEAEAFQASLPVRLPMRFYEGFKKDVSSM